MQSIDDKTLRASHLSILVSAVGVCSLLLAGCPSSSGSDDGDGTKDTGADTAADVSPDTRADTEAPDTTEDTSEPEDTGTEDTADTTKQDVDTGPPGSEVSVHTFGVLPPKPANCSMPNERQRIPFYFTTKDGSLIRPIKNGDILQGEVVRPNQTISSGTLTSRRTQVGALSREACGSSSDCEGPFKCGPGGLRGSENRCVRQTGIQYIPGSAQQDYRPNFGNDAGQLVAILFENTGMWEGVLPRYVGRRFGEDGEKDLGEVDGRATDPQLTHRDSIDTFSTALETANRSATTKVSTWFFGGTFRGETRTLFNSMGDDHFSDDLGIPKSLIKDIGSPAAKASNVYQAILKVVEEDFTLPKYEEHEKFIYLITDGPNEVYDPEATKQKVISKLKEHNIHLIVLHLDSQIDPSKLRDDPRYWQGNRDCRMDSSCGATPCTEDSQCANFETCRKAKLYPKDSSDSVTETGQKYCVPDYSDGHLGPIAAYSDIACRTNGHYLYTTKPEQMDWYARRVPYLFDGQWSVEAEISAFNPKVGLDTGFYRLSGVFFGLLSSNLSTILSLPSDSGAITHFPDSRPVMRLKRSGSNN